MLNINRIYSRRLPEKIATYLTILLIIVASVTFLDMKAQCAPATIVHAATTGRIDLIQYCVKENMPEAVVALGRLHAVGKFVPKDHHKAFGLCQIAALEGSVDGMYCLGNFYADAIGVQQNYEQAFDWFEQAATHNHEAAALRLVDCYANGIGVEQDITKAKELLDKLAKQGNVAAIKALAEYK